MEKFTLYEERGVRCYAIDCGDNVILAKEERHCPSQDVVFELSYAMLLDLHNRSSPPDLPNPAERGFTTYIKIEKLGIGVNGNAVVALLEGESIDVGDTLVTINSNCLCHRRNKAFDLHIYYFLKLMHYLAARRGKHSFVQIDKVLRHAVAFPLMLLGFSRLRRRQTGDKQSHRRLVGLVFPHCVGDRLATNKVIGN